jgi:digeranylgeranylglycerophospholipid reductase
MRRFAQPAPAMGQRYSTEMSGFDVVVAGGGPGGLSAAQSAAENGARVLLIEQGDEIGSPIRTSGGSFIRDLVKLGIPAHLYHPIRKCRFISPDNEASFSYDDPVLCIMDVRGVFQHLAAQAIGAGAHIRLATAAVEPVIENGFVCGVLTKAGRVDCMVLIDATGYRSALLRKAGLHAGFRRFGVGSEFDMYAPNYDQSEAVLIVGSQVAPSGYAWAFPWGNGRVRVGVGIIHGDSDQHPEGYLRKLCADANKFGMNLKGAQPIEHHYGLIPSDGLLENLVGNGILGVGDAAGQASALVGEGIRWAIKAGRMAGKIAAEAVARGDASAEFLGKYQKQWKSAHGANLRIAHAINERIARWDDGKWDRRTELLKLFSPDQFDEALQSNFVPGWALRLLWSHPSLVKEGIKELFANAI